MNTIHVALAADDNYAPFLGVTIYSILKNAAPEDRLCFHIMDGGISEENLEKIATLERDFTFGRHYYRPELEAYSEGLTLDRSTSACSRFFLPELLPPDVTRCLYLDVDILVLASLRELWETEMGECSVAAVPDYMSVRWPVPKHTIARNLRGTYVNSGVLLLDLQKLRENGRWRQAKEWFSQNSEMCRYVDQDAINICFDTEIHLLGAEWNVQMSRNFDYSCRPFLRQEYVAAYENPRIIHFIGKKKAWEAFYLTKVPKALYAAYLAETPWRDLPRAPLTRYQKLKLRVVSSAMYRSWRTFLIWTGAILRGLAV